MKLVIPFLVAAGILLGLYLALRGKREVVIPAGSSRLRIVVLLAASSLVSFIVSCGPGAGNKEAEEPDPGLSATMPADSAASTTPEEALESLEKRIDLLAKLLSEGKLTDETYEEVLTRIRSDIHLLETFQSTYKQELSEAEKILVDVRRELDASLIPGLAKQKAWSKLQKQYMRLRGGHFPYPSQYDHEAAMEELGKLREKGFILDETYVALSVLFEEVNDHHVFMNSGTTCYDMPLLGYQFQDWRERVSETLIGFENPNLTGDEYFAALDLITAAVTCFVDENESACDEKAQASTYGRVSMVQALDILIALSR